ncbi:hypothetical protein PIB30_062098 [Stylosanthes scabra]|uniref:Uncharacterized protein n=1 Tax=Stylosanthes scabra TaxID=79078 RepID=A0ABU6RL60_9FABA|nr:hypothetical protein [Stylosanthes scabra]
MSEEGVQADGVESLAEVERSLAAHIDGNLKLCNVEDPVANAIIMEDWEFVQRLTHDDGSGVGRWNTTTSEGGRACIEKDACSVLVGFDPMRLEAQISHNWSESNEGVKGLNRYLPQTSEAGSGLGWESETSSCPYPPGYGPCTNLIHVHHRRGDRVLFDRVEFVRESQNGEGEWTAELEGWCTGRFTLNEGVSKSREDIRSATSSESEQSDATLYLIHEEARARARFSDVETEDFVEERLGGDDCDSTRRKEGEWEQEVQIESESATDKVDEEALLAEVTESKKIWSKGGIEFDSSDEEEVRVRLVDRK